MKDIRDNVRENALVSGSIDFENYIEALFTDGKGWVCLLDDEVVGFSCGRIKQGDVWALFIRMSHEGQGVGNRLMDLLEQWMFSKGCSEIVLSTTAGTRAEKLYRRRGWEFSGTRANGELEFKLLPGTREQCELF
jgi:GNAT superfamily N-acetyltransferase